MDDRTSGMATINDSFCWSNGGGGEHHECIYNGGAGNETIEQCAADGQRRNGRDLLSTPSGGGTGDQGSLDAENDIFGGGAFTLYPGAAAHSGTEGDGPSGTAKAITCLVSRRDSRNRCLKINIPGDYYLVRNDLG